MEKLFNSSKPISKISGDAKVKILPPKNESGGESQKDQNLNQEGVAVDLTPRDHTLPLPVTVAIKNNTPVLLITSQIEQRDYLRFKKWQEKEDLKAKREEDRIIREQEKRIREEEKREKQKQREKELEERKRHKELAEQTKNMRKEKREAERKQREEERQRIELEKERLQEKKLHKANQAKINFMKYFGKSVPIKKDRVIDELFLTPFSVKCDMTLAIPPRLPLKDKSEFDRFLTHHSEYSTNYIQTCASKRRKVVKSLPVEDRSDDVVILEDVRKDCPHKYKLIQFHENHRPAYYGTWTKSRCSINPRNPFKTDKDLLDYEVDSDDEWEEEEPGESISNSEGEDKEGDAEGENSDDEDGFFVPHGYLSNDEGDCSDTGEAISGDDPHESKRQSQLAKAWEAEFARKCQPLHARKIGCLWINTPPLLINAHPVPPSEEGLSKDETFLMQFSALSLVSLPIDVSTKEASSELVPGSCNHSETTRQPVPEEAMPDLIRFIHKSPIGVMKIIKAFRTHWGAKNSRTSPNSPIQGSPLSPSRNDVSPITPLPDKSNITPKSTKTPAMFLEYENASGISKRQLEKKIQAIAVKELRYPISKAVWYVHDHIMKQCCFDQENFVPLVSYDDSATLCERREESPAPARDSVTPNTAGTITDLKKAPKRKGKSLIHFLSKSPVISAKRPKVEDNVVEPSGDKMLSPRRVCLETVCSSEKSPVTSAKRPKVEDKILGDQKVSIPPKRPCLESVCKSPTLMEIGAPSLDLTDSLYCACSQPVDQVATTTITSPSPKQQQPQEPISIKH